MAKKKKQEKNKQILLRVLHQKGLTVKEIAKELNEAKVAVELMLNAIGLKPKFEHQKPEPSSVFCLGKRVKI